MTAPKKRRRPIYCQRCRQPDGECLCQPGSTVPPPARDTTFGELAIGDYFEWRDTAEIQSGPPGPEPMTKATATRYEWSRGYGTAEPHYPVRMVRRRKERRKDVEQL